MLLLLLRMSLLLYLRLHGSLLLSLILGLCVLKEDLVDLMELLLMEVHHWLMSCWWGNLLHILLGILLGIYHIPLFLEHFVYQGLVLD